MSDATHLIIAENEFNKIIAFMGTENDRLEMLFICSAERGKGIGKQLLKYGIEKFGIKEVTANEQNPQAVSFYEHLGFKVYKRTAHDEQGNPHPLLYFYI